MVMFGVVAPPADGFEIVRVVTPTFAFGLNVVGVKLRIPKRPTTGTALLTLVVVPLIDVFTNFIPVVRIPIVPPHVLLT
jgi:hypothetical protein